jgi:lipid-binding SYLF domain-containing protein
MKMYAGLMTIVTLFSTVGSMSAEDVSAKLNSRIAAATTVLHQLAAVPDKGIPDRISRKARCVLVIPGFKKGAFLGGAQYGQGVATCFDATKGWSAPVFVQMAGVSFGLQAGGQATDLVLVGISKESGIGLLKAKLKLGGDAAVAAGPVGRDSQADTTEIANAEFLTYSRNKGLFAGIDLSGDEVNQNTKDTEAFYGTDIPYQTILNGSTPAPAAAKPFIREVRRVFGGPKRRSKDK